MAGLAKYNGERNNLRRLERLIHEHGTIILRGVLEKKVLHLPSRLHQCSKILRKKCKTDQIKVLYPTDGSTFSTANCDISLLALLLRTKEFSGISAPPTGWGHRTPETDTNPNADISRIIYYRNKLSHITDQDQQRGVTDAEYEEWWDEITNVLSRLAKHDCLDFQPDHLKNTHGNKKGKVTSQASSCNIRLP